MDNTREWRLRLVLLEAPLETVPRELWNHPQVARSARRYGVEPGRLLLDKSLHYNAMEVLPQKWKRGRPDIVHTTLMVLQDTLLPQEMLEVYIHVLDGRVFRLSPNVRLPKNYERFKGLMAQLLEEGQVPPRGEPLVWVEYNSLGELAREMGLILLWERGKARRPGEVVARALATGMSLGIGMFPRGDFKRSTLRKAVEAYSIAGGRPLKAWGVAGRLLYSAERILGLV